MSPGDHDGVLVDIECWYFAATQECLAAFGVSLDQFDYLSFMAGARSCWELASAQGISTSMVEGARRRRDRRYRELLRTAAIDIEGVIDTLAALAPIYRMAIVSTTRRSDLDLIHQDGSILPFFEFVLTIEDYANPKPAPDPYLAALARFQAQPADALAIEDSARTGLHRRAERLHGRADFSGAWSVLDSVRDLRRVLSGKRAT